MGKGFATALAVNGAKVRYKPVRAVFTSQVIINGRRADVINATAAEINAAAKATGLDGEVIAIQGDVATKQGVVEFYEACSKHLDKVSGGL